MKEFTARNVVQTIKNDTLSQNLSLSCQTCYKVWANLHSKESDNMMTPLCSGCREGKKREKFIAFLKKVME